MISVTLNFSEILAQKVTEKDRNHLLTEILNSNRSSVKDLCKCSNVDKSMSLDEGNESLNIEKHFKFSSLAGIPFVLTYIKPPQYSLQINCSSPIVNDVQVSIKDIYTNTITPILFNGITMYGFTVENDIIASRSANRFSLVFVSTADFIFNGLSISGDTTCKHIKLSFNTKNACEMKNYGIEYGGANVANTDIKNPKDEINVISFIVKLKLGC